MNIQLMDDACGSHGYNRSHELHTEYNCFVGSKTRMFVICTPVTLTFELHHPFILVCIILSHWSTLPRMKTINSTYQLIIV